MHDVAFLSSVESKLKLSSKPRPPPHMAAEADIRWLHASGEQGQLNSPAHCRVILTSTIAWTSRPSVHPQVSLGGVKCQEHRRFPCHMEEATMLLALYVPFFGLHLWFCTNQYAAQTLRVLSLIQCPWKTLVSKIWRSSVELKIRLTASARFYLSDGGARQDMPVDSTL